MSFLRVVGTAIQRLFIILILVVAFMGSALTAMYLSRGKEVIVPSILNKTQKDAKIVAQQSGLLVDTIEIFDENAPANLVVRQEPKAGMVVKSGYTIKVYYSTGVKKP